MAQEYQSSILVTRAGIDADGKSIMELLSLAASKGLEIEISATGPDEDAALAALSALVEDKFGEEV